MRAKGQRVEKRPCLGKGSLAKEAVNRVSCWRMGPGWVWGLGAEGSCLGKKVGAQDGKEARLWHRVGDSQVSD